jgi:hypothetical protein
MVIFWVINGGYIMAGKWMFNHQQIGIEWEYIWEIVGDSLRQSPQKDGGLSLGKHEKSWDIS